MVSRLLQIFRQNATCPLCKRRHEIPGYSSRKYSKAKNILFNFAHKRLIRFLPSGETARAQPNAGA